MSWKAAGCGLGWALVLVAAGGCAGALQSSSTTRLNEWSRIDTPHFALSSNLDGRTALRIARILEETRASLLALAWTGAKDPRGRTEVIAFARPSEFQHYTGQPTLAGLALSQSSSERILAFRLGAEGDVPKVVVHELAHDLSHWFMPFQPSWFSEGLAVYLENVKFDESTSQATMGELSADSLQWIGSTKFVIGASKLLAADTALRQDPREQASFYASSWLLVHYLMNREPDAFNRFQLGLTRLSSGGQAWKEAFPDLKLEQLDASVIEYIRALGVADANVAQSVSDKVHVPAFEPHQRRLSEAEAHGVLARLSTRLEPRVGERELAEALRLDPNELNALVVQFIGLPPDSAQRRELAQRAAAAHPESAEAWLLLAHTEPPGAARTAALERARGLAEAHPGVATLLAEEDVRRGDMQAALTHTRLALGRAPPTPSLLALRVIALASEHQCAAARNLAYSGGNLFAASCREQLPAQNRDVSCAEYLSSSWDSVQSRCAEAPKDKADAQLSPAKTP